MADDTDDRTPPETLARAPLPLGQSMRPSPLGQKRRLGERFEIERWLGEGGMGTVYLAHDRALGTRVAIKVLLGAEPDALSRFKREFRALADVSHPNLIVLHELHHIEGSWLFTMDYVEGQDFLSTVSTLEGRNAPTLLEVEAHRMRAADAARATYGRPLTPLRDEPLLRRVLEQLVSAIRALHAAHKLHLDLKPSNVIVSKEGMVTVLDFGLARDLGAASQVRTQRVIGTPAYMSPEQAQGKPFDTASDWYSLGVMLFEALTGRLPFEGSIPEIMLGKSERDPIKPSDLVRGVPPDLDALCLALIARFPQDRPSGDEIASRLGMVPAPLVTRAAAANTGELFVGRSDALTALRESPRAHSSHQPRMLLIHGSSGVGKSTLARRFVRELESRGDTLVLQGACYEREAVPFKAWDGAVDGLVEYLLALSPTEVTALMPRHRDVLPRLFPAFAKLIPALPQAPDQDLEVDRARAFHAFSELLGRLSERTQVVIFIDDLHWGDLDSALLMREIFEGKDPPDLLVLGTYRPEEAEDSPFFRELSQLERSASKVDIARLSISALTPEDARVLSLELLSQRGIQDTALASHIAAESQGVPLFVHELVRHASLSQTGMLQSTHVSLGEALGRRIARLPSPAIALLEVLAVAGRPLAQQAAYDAAGLPIEDRATLHALRAAGFAKSRGGGPADVAETYHDRIREVVVSGLPKARLKQVHGRLLEQLERRGDHDFELLVAHSLGAERPERALTYAERAAERAQKALAFNRAADLYQTALDCLKTSHHGEVDRQAELERRLAESLAAAGRCLEAAAAYLQAATLVDAQVAETLERHAADQLLRGGDLQRGIALLKQVFERHDLRYPSGSRSALAALAIERTRLLARGLTFEDKPSDPKDASERTTLDALRLALGVYWLVEPVRGALFATQYLRRALDLGDARHVLRGLETECAYVALIGGTKAEQRAAELIGQCRSLAKRTQSATTMGGLKFAEASFHAIYGRKELSRACALEALSHPNQPGLSWERAYARFHLYQSALYIGGRHGLADEIELVIQEAETRHDRFAVATLLPTLSMARLMSDEPARALTAMSSMAGELSPDVFSFLDMQETLWTAISHTYVGDYSAALHHYEARHGRYAASGMPRLQVWRVLQIWGTMLAHLGALSAEPRDRARRVAVMERIKQIEAEGLSWPLCFASLGRASLLHLQGHTAESQAALKTAAAQADQMGYHPFAATYRLCSARLTGDEAAQHEQIVRLNQLGVKNAMGWLRAWAPGFHV